MTAAVGSGGDVRHADFFFQDKANAIGCLYSCRAAQTVEAVDNQHARLFARRFIRAQRFGGETHAAGIGGSDAETVNHALADRQLHARMVSGADNLPVVEIAIPEPRIYNICIRLRRFLQRIHGCAPRKRHALSVCVEQGRKAVRRQGLDDRGGRTVVHECRETQKGFINRTRQLELKQRVVRVFHIREVLMRKHFEDSRRHAGHTRLGIVAVPKFAARPCAFDERR